MTVFYSVVIGYFLGSFPTAYILSRLFFRGDIREKGSGNVGTLNFLRVTQSKLLAIVVLLIDAGKGYLAMLISNGLVEPQFLILPAMAVVLGHIFPVWLKGKGGRGLATLGGIMLYLEPAAVLVWWFLFGAFYLVTKKYIFAGVAAIILVNLFIAFFYDKTVFYILSSTSMIVLLKYTARLREEFTKA